MCREPKEDSKCFLEGAKFCEFLSKNSIFFIMYHSRSLYKSLSSLRFNTCHGEHSGLLTFQRIRRLSSVVHKNPSSCVKSPEKYYSSSSSSVPGKKISDLDSNITPEMISHLERTSLVGFGSEEAVARLEEAIKFASVLFEVDTTGVEPMDSVLEKDTLHLRDDEPIKTNREDIIRNAAIIEEDYFVAPPGNIPLEADQLSPDILPPKKSQNSSQ